MKTSLAANRGGVRVKDSSSEEEEPQPKRASNARKAGPKGRKAKKYETVLPKAIFATQDLKYCGYCGKIFVSIKGEYATFPVRLVKFVLYGCLWSCKQQQINCMDFQG